jgi:hypothetical protein
MNLRQIFEVGTLHAGDRSPQCPLVFSLFSELQRWENDARMRHKVDHTTIFRWVQAYRPEMDKRCRLHLKETNDS